MSWLSSKLGRKIGFRYLRSKKSSSFLSLVTGISIVGIAIGVLTLIVTLSVMSGFEGEMKKRLFEGDTHVLINHENNFFDRDLTLISQLQTLNSSVQKVFPVLQTEVILRSGKKVIGGQIKGVEEDQLNWIKKYVNEWAPKEYLENYKKTERLLLGQEMAFQLSVVAGDLVTIVSPVENDGPFGAVPRMKQYIVEGIYKTSIPEQEIHTVFTDIRSIEDFLKISNTLSQIEVRTTTMEEAEKIKSALVGKINPQYLVRTWQDLNSHLFRSLKLERLAMFATLFIIIIVATFNIASTLTMMVIEKKKSLSILRAMGANPGQISSIFLWEGTAIGLVGISFGSGISLLICYALARYQFIELPEFFYDRSLPVEIDPISISLIIFGAMLIVILGSYLPSKKASQLTPLEGIRESRS